jgi:large subunit ribosomal protein L4
MSFSPLSTKDAASKLKVDLIENGIGTQALHETVVAYRANRRAGTHSTKTKATVAGSGKKPWRQKGTGNPRRLRFLARLERRRRGLRPASPQIY